MLNEKCYGILSDENLIFNKNQLKKDLEFFCIKAIHDGANAFILGANTEFDNIAFKVCKNMQKRHKSKNIIIKIVLSNIDILKNPEQYQTILQNYAQEHLIFVYNETKNKQYEIFLTQQFIVNNSYKCLGHIDNNNVDNLKSLSIYPFTIINLYNGQEIRLQKDTSSVELFDEQHLKNITLYDK